MRRLEWTPTWDEFLVGLMVDEVNKGRKGDKGFTKESWNYIVSEFNKKFNVNLNQQQLRSRYNYYKKEYKIVKTLLSQSDFGWDESRKIVTAEPEVWDRYILAHPEAKQYLTKGLPLLGEMGKIIGNSAADGKALPSSHRGEVLEEAARGMVALQSENEESDSSEDMNASYQRYKRKYVTPTSSCHSKKERKGTDLAALAAALQEMAASSRFRASLITGANSKQELKNCIEELQTMENLDDVLFVKACKMLKDEKNALVFMTLKGHRRLLWVKEMCDAL
ncbi:hypothetical protein AMTR_s00014p00247240 [Amborella trichopoda]|uniref:Myb/SANT-like domain-containing protein n=2 Tax=Amborella trichopoda TaxID=13333 RepID=W1PNC2_AMBTC|nr:hypothetical protein AMTR_s00014p00247240 [Amborella trichopoda]